VYRGVEAADGILRRTADAERRGEARHPGEASPAVEFVQVPPMVSLRIVVERQAPAIGKAPRPGSQIARVDDARQNIERARAKLHPVESADVTAESGGKNKVVERG